LSEPPLTALVKANTDQRKGTKNKHRCGPLGGRGQKVERKKPRGNKKRPGITEKKQGIFGEFKRGRVRRNPENQGEESFQIGERISVKGNHIGKKKDGGLGKYFVYKRLFELELCGKSWIGTRSWKAFRGKLRHGKTQSSRFRVGGLWVLERMVGGQIRVHLRRRRPRKRSVATVNHHQVPD